MPRGCRALLMILICTMAHVAAAAPKPAHYDVHARFDAGTGDFNAEVTVTLPPEELQDPAFLFGGHVSIDAVEVGGGGTSRIERVDTPLAGLQLVTLLFEQPPTRAVKVRFRYHGSVNSERDQPGFTPSGVELRLEHFW